MPGALIVDGDGGAVPPSVLSPLAGPGEVETEYEDLGDEEEEDGEGQEQRPLEEVEEELDEAYDGHETLTPASASSAPTGDYAVPEANREVWKNFGCDTEAGRALRKLYQPAGANNVASKISYPRLKSPAAKWEPKTAPRKPCPQRAAVRVPVQRPKSRDMDDPRNWRVPIPCRKPAEQILAEMEADKPQKPNLVQGRDQGVVKNNLQKRFEFCGGRAMPKGAMGHVEYSEELPKNDGPTMREMIEGRRQIDENGMNAEHREIFQELMLAVQRKQARIAELDKQNEADPQPSKEKTQRNKEALELRNDIDRCMKDIDKLMELCE